MNIRKNYKKHAIISGLLAFGLIGGSLSSGTAGDPVFTIGVIAFLWFAYVMLRYHRCPRCKKSLTLFDFRSVNCRYCGSSLNGPEVDWLKCPSCGKSNRKYALDRKRIRFCGYCGFPLDKHIRNE